MMKGLTEQLRLMDKRIEEIALSEPYAERVQRLRCRYRSTPSKGLIERREGQPAEIMTSPGGHYPDGSVGVRFRFAPPHTYASRLILEVVQCMEAGHRDVQSLARHASLIQTNKYSHEIKDPLQGVVKDLRIVTFEEKQISHRKY
jgi:hypothetical protein